MGVCFAPFVFVFYLPKVHGRSGTWVLVLWYFLPAFLSLGNVKYVLLWTILHLLNVEWITQVSCRCMQFLMLYEQILVQRQKVKDLQNQMIMLHSNTHLDISHKAIFFIIIYDVQSFYWGMCGSDHDCGKATYVVDSNYALFLS